jgi:TolB-like protein/tetratricopeptide (TPR) repeat protein
MIGTQALGREESFDPRLDPIVRTQARKLRARLAKYYETEGLTDTLIIEYPKGSYAPVFHERRAETPPQPIVAVPNAAAPVLPRRWIAIALAAFVLVTAAAVYFWQKSETRPALAGSASIAVMPFLNIGGNEDEFLSDGLTEELIDSLGQVPWLQVVARTSAFRFKGKGLTTREIAEQLKVSTLLEGSIRKSGNRLRVSVQLNNASDGAHLWSGSFDRDSNDTHDVQLEIAKSVTDVLSIRFARGSRPETPAFTGANQPVPSAYQSYLRGRFFWNKISASTWNTAVEQFKQAIALDPSFAPAYSALADSYVMAPPLTGVLPLEVVPKIREAAMKALELDSRLGEAHFDLAVCAQYEFDWATAEKEFRRGLELSPGNAVGHLWYAKFLAIQGRKDEVLVQRRIAAELDPVSPYAVQSVGGYFSVTGRYDEAISHFRAALTLDPQFGLAHQGLGVAYLLKGNRDEAVAEMKEANRLMGGPARTALLGYVYGSAGKTEEARKILDDFLKRYGHEPISALSIAHVYIGLGDKDRAFEWLEKAVDQRDLDLTLQWDSLYDSLRRDPRYHTLLSKMRLV